MADDNSQQERTEKATAKRRDDFRKKGQVAQSKELGSAALMSSFLLLWFFYGQFLWDRLALLVAELWQASATFEITPPAIVHLTAYILQKVGLLLAPILLLVLVVGFLSTFLQIGWLFTTRPLVPDFAKLDPIKGAAKFFSKRSLVEVVKSLAKMLLVGFVAYKTFSNEFEDALHLVDMEVAATLYYVCRVVVLVLLKSCAVLIVLGLLDFGFVRWEMEQKMRMTKQELREEFRDTEGDPHLKARIRSIQQQMARKRMMAEVPKADVVITNPTHIAVALIYKRGEMDAPRVVAKGADHLAQRIREIARENKIPIVENPPVARALHKVDLGTAVPEELFRAVAEILAYIYRLNKKQGLS